MQQSVERIVLGFPTPLEYISPKLNCYPLMFPRYILYTNDFNNFNVNLTEQDRLKFVKRLMSLMERKYMIVGQILIDLDRQDYILQIKENNMVEIIKEYGKDPSTIFYVENDIDTEEDLFPSNHPKYVDNNDIIEEHCRRIYKKTNILLTRLEKLFMWVDKTNVTLF